MSALCQMVQRKGAASPQTRDAPTELDASGKEEAIHRAISSNDSGKWGRTGVFVKIKGNHIIFANYHYVRLSFLLDDTLLGQAARACLSATLLGDRGGVVVSGFVGRRRGSGGLGARFLALAGGLGGLALAFASM